MLKRRGASRPLISIENDAAHARMVKRQLERLGLSDYARLVIAELVPYQGPSNVDVWYDVGVVRGAVDSVDMLVVDGPPIRLAKRARSPAIEVFAPHLVPGAIILLDDAKRPDERQVLKEWKRAYPQVSMETEPSERGIAKLTWPDASN
jgi:predicted O-methyltransferase YrrM